MNLSSLSDINSNLSITAALNNDLSISAALNNDLSISAALNNDLSITAALNNDAENTFTYIPSKIISNVISPLSKSEIEYDTSNPISEPKSNSSTGRSSAAAKPKLIGSISGSIKYMKEELMDTEHTSGTQSFSGRNEKIQGSIYTSNESIIKKNNDRNYSGVDLARAPKLMDGPDGEESINTGEESINTGEIPQETSSEQLKSYRLITADSLENLKLISNAHQKKAERDQMSENDECKSKLGSKLFNGSLSQVFGKSFSKSQDFLVSDACSLNDEKSTLKIHIRETTPHPLKINIQNSKENLSLKDATNVPKFHSTSNIKVSHNHLSTTHKITEEKKDNNEVGSFGDLLTEGLDNILPLNPRLNAGSSLSSSSSPTSQFIYSSDCRPRDSSRNSSNVTSTDMSLLGNFSRYEASVFSEKEKSPQKSSLFAKIRLALKKKLSKPKSKSDFSIRKEPLKLPPDFVLKPIIRAGKGETLIDPELMQSLYSSPKRYVFKGVTLPTEISYDSKRVGFNPNAIDISEAIRVSELGEIPGIGKGSSAVIPVHFISTQTKIRKE